LFYQDLLSRANALPGVEVAAIGPLPLNDMRLGSANRRSSGGGMSCCFEVSADYFRAMGIQLRAGRSFTEQDRENAPPVAIINESAARLIYRGEDPIGKPVQYGYHSQPERDGIIVGVVADVKRYGLESGADQGEQYNSVLQNAESGSPYL